MRSCKTIACPRVRLVLGQMRRALTICFDLGENLHR